MLFNQNYYHVAFSFYFLSVSLLFCFFFCVFHHLSCPNALIYACWTSYASSYVNNIEK